MISVDEYCAPAIGPTGDLIDGEVVERTVGLRSHGRAQAEIGYWFQIRKDILKL